MRYGHMKITALNLVLIVSIFNASLAQKSTERLMFGLSFENLHSAQIEGEGGNLMLGFALKKSELVFQYTQLNVAHSKSLEYLMDYNLPIPERLHEYAIHYDHHINMKKEWTLDLLGGISYNNMVGEEYGYYQLKNYGKRIKEWTGGLSLGAGFSYIKLDPFVIFGKIVTTQSRHIDFGPAALRFQIGLKYKLRIV